MSQLDQRHLRYSRVTRRCLCQRALAVSEGKSDADAISETGGVVPLLLEAAVWLEVRRKRASLPVSPRPLEKATRARVKTLRAACGRARPALAYVDAQEPRPRVCTPRPFEGAAPKHATSARTSGRRPAHGPSGPAFQSGTSFVRASPIITETRVTKTGPLAHRPRSPRATSRRHRHRVGHPPSRERTAPIGRRGRRRASCARGVRACGVYRVGHGAVSR